MRALTTGFLLLLISKISVGQNSGLLSEELLTRANKHVKTIYSESNKLRIYQGPQYNPIFVNPETDTGHPFYLRDSIRYELIEYEGIEYNNVPLLFDLLQDKVISIVPNTGIRISLIQEKISRFTINEHLFVKIEKGLTPHANLKAGFYDLLYQGDKVRVYASRKKEISQADHGFIVKKKYTDKEDLYILKNGIFFSVRKKKDVLTLIADQRENLEKELFRKSYNRRNFENFIVSVCKAYDTL